MMVLYLGCLIDTGWVYFLHKTGFAKMAPEPTPDLGNGPHISSQSSDPRGIGTDHKKRLLCTQNWLFGESDRIDMPYIMVLVMIFGSDPSPEQKPDPSIV
jgi:hypothetical protein